MEIDKPLEKIVQRCQNDDKAAFEKLFEIFHPRLKYYVRRLDSSDAIDDILQEIWLTVIKKIHKLKDIQAFSAWLYRIARNKVYDKYRKKDRHVPLSEEKELPESIEDKSTFDVYDAIKLHRALNNLKPHHREVLTLNFIEQMSYKAIAGVVDCSIGTVRSRLFHAKQSLRKEMERQNG